MQLPEDAILSFIFCPGEWQSQLGSGLLSKQPLAVRHFSVRTAKGLCRVFVSDARRKKETETAGGNDPESGFAVSQRTCTTNNF
jgi:hypothetical protein